MNSQERRKAITDMLKNASAPISATKLAVEFSVTRQIIVADIALLRASGLCIVSDNKGYSMGTKPVQDGMIKRIVVKHKQDDVSEEFYAVVDNGGKVLDIIVEHSLYGKISAELNITSRYEADLFVEKLQETGACPLSVLTEGIHIHTVSVKDEETFARITKKLKDLGILIEAE
jgi:transcriptional regulator of NAD metabolism